MLRSTVALAFKVFLRRKLFTLISLFGISVTLVVLVVAAALFDHVFGPLPPQTRQHRSLEVQYASLSSEQMIQNGSAGYKFLKELRGWLPQAEAVTIHSQAQPVVSYVGGQRIGSYLKRTDGEFWRVLQFRFLEGRPFTDDEERNASRVAVINEATRQRFFAGAPALGKTLEADGQRFVVVGVVPNVPRLRLVPFADIWVPISTAKTDSYKSELVGGFMATILARSAADLPALKAEVAARVPTLEVTKPFTRFSAAAESQFEAFARLLFTSRDDSPAGGRLALLIAVLALLFMLLPTINLVNLNVSRILERASEIGVRKAFGASSRALVTQFVVENVLLCLIGGAIALFASLAALSAIEGSGLLPYTKLALNARVFLYGLLLSIFFGVLSGVYPAWRMSRLNPVDALSGRTR
jgi:putative ABC transport system permease protein